MPYFIIDIWYYQPPSGRRRDYSVRTEGYPAKEDAEAAVAAEAVQRQQRRAEWEGLHGQPFPGDDHYVVEAENAKSALPAALRERLGRMPGDFTEQEEQERLNAALGQAADGYPEWADRLLAAGADPNGFPLIMAIQANETPDIVQAMLAAGADPNRPFGETTPLVRGVETRNPAVVRALIQAGADVNLRAEKA